ncbi:MAG: DUF4058 family protein [Pirellulaceae bacterium]|nr:DUF4058 family protein [Pirellulaceae bacterium]
MRSPFPGMDPFLESRWPEVHARLIVYATNQINSHLPDDLQANIEENLAVYADDRSDRSIRPDVNVSEDPFRATSPVATSTAVLAEPLVVRRPKNPNRHVEIVTADGRLITAIEFISPWNKVGTRAREQYTRKQLDYLDAGVNLVEIDLVRQGSYVLAASLDDIPESQRTPYMICVYRDTEPDQFELYRAPLQERLPNIPIPLRPGERDIVLELQPLIDECYRDGRYHRIDYHSDIKLNFSESDLAWISQRLREIPKSS